MNILSLGANALGATTKSCINNATNKEPIAIKNSWLFIFYVEFYGTFNICIIGT